MPSPGRNESCPCGSGRKYKHWCQRAASADDVRRVRLREAEGVLLPALMAHADAELGDEFFAEAWEEFFVWDSVPGDVDASREYGTTFDPFFVFSFVPDAADSEPLTGWPSEPLALHFLHHEVESCPDFQREFIEQACRSHASFFVVEAADPGRSVDLKDILTGRRFHVLEQSASRTFQPGHLTYTRVVTAGGASIMIGAAPWIIPASWHLPVIEFRQRCRQNGLMTREDLHEWDIEIRAFYHQIVDQLLHPRLPQLANTDGDPIEMIAMTYDLLIPAGDVFERLKPLAVLGGEEHIEDVAHDAPGALVSATLSWIKAGNRKNKGWDNTILGTLRLDGSTLTVEVNSAKRRDRIAKEIAARLGSAATLVNTTVTDVAKALEARRAERAAGGAAGAGDESADDADAVQTPEMAAIEAGFLQRHWDAWVDEKVPALRNKTPRQAVKTAIGREKVEALLSDFAQEGRGIQGRFRPDIGAIRRKLGLE
jgi:hypothetical protein